jgi:Domain of unknown function (DUF4266)
MDRKTRGAKSRRRVERADLCVLLLCAPLAGCATVAPEQRAILADPTMQFDAEAKHDAALRHAIDNREGSTGGAGVSGGGCGCN